MEVIYRFVYSLLEIVFWTINVFLIVLYIRQNKIRHLLKYICAKNFINIILFIKFVNISAKPTIGLFLKFYNNLEIIIFKVNNEHALRNYVLNFFKNRILLQELKEAVMECFFVLLFSPRQFSFYSSLVFGTFILFKTVHQTCLQNFKIQKSSKKNLKSSKLFFFFANLFFVTFFEAAVAKIYLSGTRRRIVNLIIGAEVLYLTSSLKESIVDHFLTVANDKLFEGKWKFQGACELYLQNLISVSNFFSYTVALNNLSISKKGIFKYYVLRRAFQCGKEFFQNFEEYTRHRKTQICIGTVMQNPTNEDIQNFSDNVCIVCRDDMLPDMSKKLPCKHVLHTLCLQDWLRRQFGCPICMAPISSSISKTKKQSDTTETFSIKKTKINTIALATGFSKSKMLARYFMNNQETFSSLPSLFPDFTNLFFWTSRDPEKSSVDDSRKKFYALIKHHFFQYDSINICLNDDKKKYFSNYVQQYVFLQ